MADGEDRGQPHIGVAVPRVDGPQKVTGHARYGSDFAPEHPTYAALAVSSIARGRITAIDEAAARAMPGVLEILTFRNVGAAVKPGKTFSDKGYMGSSIGPLASDKVWHAGQIVAVVVADTSEAAEAAAHGLKISYAEERPTADFGDPGADTVAAKDVSKDHEDPAVGDAEGAFAAAPVKIDGRYSTPTQHHNPIELFTTVCAWSGGKLTVWESSQNVWGAKTGVAEQLGISADDVHFVSPYIGGAR